MKLMDNPSFDDLKEIANKGLDDCFSAAKYWLNHNDKEKFLQCCIEIQMYASAYLAIGLFTDEIYLFYYDEIESLIQESEKEIKNKA